MNIIIRTNIQIYVTIFAKMCVVHKITNNYKYHFEILKAVNLQNALCIFYVILRQSIVIQGNSIGVLSSGLLAELSAILNGFLPIPQVIS